MPVTSVGQDYAVSFEKVMNEKKDAVNQWASNPAMDFLQKQGAIKRESLGRKITVTLDAQPNPGAAVQEFDTDSVDTDKTLVFVEAQYEIGEVVVPASWTKKQEATNSQPAQKVKLVSGLIKNQLKSHDNLWEQLLFANAATFGIESLKTSITANGEGEIGTIDAAIDTYWMNQFDDHDNANSQVIEAAVTRCFLDVEKGSGDPLKPTLIISDSTTLGVFHGVVHPFQRFINTEEAKAGFKAVSFMGAQWIHSQYADSNIFLLNPDAIYLTVASNYWKQKGAVIEHTDKQGYISKMTSFGALVTANRSRLGRVNP